MTEAAREKFDAMTPCTEDVARLAAQQIERYHTPIPVDLPKALAPAPVVAGEDGEDGDPDDLGGW